MDSRGSTGVNKGRSTRCRAAITPRRPFENDVGVYRETGRSQMDDSVFEEDPASAKFIHRVDRGLHDSVIFTVNGKVAQLVLGRAHDRADASWAVGYVGYAARAAPGCAKSEPSVFLGTPAAIVAVPSSGL